MNKDVRLYRRSTLLQCGIEEETIDALEVTHHVGKDGRFQLLTDASKLQIPACSYISRSNDDAWFLDTGVEIDEGQLYIGRGDFEGLATVAGFVSKSSVARVMDENERLKRELDTCHKLITDLRTAVGDLVGLSTVDRTSEGSLTQLSSSVESTPQRDEADDKEPDLSLDA
jgi:hypothetical protein